MSAIPALSALQMVHELHDEIHHDTSRNDHGAEQSNQPGAGRPGVVPGGVWRPVDENIGLMPNILENIR